MPDAKFDKYNVQELHLNLKHPRTNYFRTKNIGMHPPLVYIDLSTKGNDDDNCGPPFRHDQSQWFCLKGPCFNFGDFSMSPI